MSNLRPITGNKNIDPFIRLGLIAGAGYLTWRLIVKLKSSGAFSTPVNQTPISLPGNCSAGQINSVKIRNMVDNIYSLLLGPNVYKYTDEVNKLASLNVCSLQYANEYFKQTYSSSGFATLYSYIYDEAFSTYYYAPALNALKNAGVGI